MVLSTHVRHCPHPHYLRPGRELPPDSRTEL